MRAIVCEEWGGPEKLVLKDIDPPLLGAGQVRLKVSVAAVTFVDLLMPRGKYQVKPDLPFTPGSHAAGEVIEVADDVTNIKAGDRICGYAAWGALADEMIVDESACFELPDGVDNEVGAAYGNGYATSFYALRDRGKLQPGETLLVPRPHNALAETVSRAVLWRCVHPSLGCGLLRPSGAQTRDCRMRIQP